MHLQVCQMYGVASRCWPSAHDRLQVITRRYSSRYYFRSAPAELGDGRGVREIDHQVSTERTLPPAGTNSAIHPLPSSSLTWHFQQDRVRSIGVMAMMRLHWYSGVRKRRLSRAGATGGYPASSLPVSNCSFAG